MASKRKKKDLKSLMPEKKAKENKSEFNGTVFKSMLKDPSKAFKALETFIGTAKQLPCANLYDVVEGYIKISAECAEILALLEGDTHSETEFMLIFQSLELILLRTASDLSCFNLLGSHIVKKIVSSHMKLLQSSLCSGNHQFVRRCLCLMTAMVSQGTESANEMFNSLVFNKSLSNLAHKRDRTGRPDIRMSYIQFALSFLMYGDTATIIHALDTKDFLSEILNTELKEDRISTISLILSTFQTKIVQNTAVSKTQKIRFFTASTLTRIASLYRWNGTVNITDHSVTMNEQEKGRLVVRESVHSFLLDLCCSRKHGISFHDTSLGTIGRAGNIVLLQFVVSLKQAVEDEKVAELLISILKSNPDILHRYFMETQICFTPRMKGAWLDSITLLKKIYQSQPEVSQAFQLQEVVPVPHLLSMVLVTTLPPVCNKAFFTQGLNLNSVLGQHVTLSVIALILRRAQKNIVFSLERPMLDSFDACNQGCERNAKDEFVQLYRGALSKVLPDIMSIVSKWQSLSKYEKKEDELQIGLSKLSAEEEVTAHEHGDQNQRLILFKALLLQVICLYQKVVPHLVTESKFDFSKLFKGIVSEKGMNDDVPPILQYQILQLALELPASKFSWFRFQDVVAPEFEGRDSSVLYMLLKMFVNCSNTQLRSATKMLIIKVLRESGAFEHNWKELELWLNQLVLLQPSQQETVIHFLDLVLMRVVLNPYKYTDTVAAMVQEAVCLQAKIRGADWDTRFAPISCIDDVPGVDDVIIEASGKDPDNTGLSLTDDIILQTFPFSAAVPAVLEARNKQHAAFIDGKSVLCEYICAVLCDILHSQRDPLALCLTLQSYDKELLSSENLSTHTLISDFHMYYYKWLNQLHQETLFSPVQSTTSVPASDFSAYMKACYCAGPSTFLKDSFWKGLEKSLSTLKLSEFIGAVSQTLIYLKSFVETFCSLSRDHASNVVGCMLEVMHALIFKLYNIAETPAIQSDTQEEEDFFLDMNFTDIQEVSKEQVLLIVSKLVFKHPVLQQYFLAFELGVMPSHSLDSERMRQISRQLTKGVLKLLKSCVETLKTLNGMDVINPYLSAIQGALLSELKQINRCLVEESQTVEAFLALHEYIEPSSVSEVLTALLLLPQSSLLAGGDKMSLYGNTLLKILTKSISHTCDGSTTHSLSQVHLRSLAALHSSCYTTELEEIFLQVLHRDPGCAKMIPTDVLLHCLQFSCSLELAALLVQHCSTHCLTFELWCLEQSDLAHITAQNSGFLPLLSSYFQQVTTEDPCRPKEVQKAVIQVLTKSLLDELSCSVLQEHADVPLELGVELLSSLIPLGAMDIEVTKLMQGLPVLLEKPETSDQRWQLADIITKKLTCTPEHMQWRKSLLTSSLRWLSATYKEHTKPLIKTEETMLHRLKSLLISSEDVMDLDWNTFVKSGLKYRYKDKMFLSTLNSLLEPMYGSVLSSKELLPISTIHMMVTSHSLFMPTMLAPLDDTEFFPYSKEALVTLLLTLVRKCPEVCKSNHFHVLLGAYGATLSNTDQKMLLLLKEYEKNNMSLMEFQYLLWGHAAVEYHKARKSLGPSLWQQLNSESLLDQLIEDRMLNTITHFPLNKCLVPQENEDLDSTDEKEGSPDPMCLYDPAFLIPLFSYIVRPEALLDCRTFVCRHALGLTVVALSSYDHKMRAAAYHVLGSFYQHLESGHFKEKKQLIYLLDTIRNAIQKQNLRVSFMHAVYIAKVAQQILRPEEHMYLVISKFLLGSQYVDLKRVPDFFRLFYSFDLEHKLERDWLLKVLEMGMRDGLCYELCEQQSIFHTLLGFSSSPLCDQSVQIQIVNVLCKTAQLPKASHDFSKTHGILTWILQLTKRENVDRRMPTILIGLLYNLWFSLLGKTSRVQWSNSADMQLKSLGKCLPFSLVNDFLCALLSVIRYLRTEVEPSDMESFLQILHSVLKHHGTALNSNKDTNWLHPQTLSCTAAVNLLYCWGKLASDTKLLCCLHDLFKLQNIKILHGAWQEKVQGTDNCKDCHTEKYMQSLIKCKPLLLSVLTHWDPWSDKNSNPATVLPPNSFCLHSDKTASLMTATAHTLIKWTLWTLSEMPFDEYLTFATLKWMEKVIVPHEAIARSLISDEAMRIDLLKLYQQTCEQSAYKLTLQVFTTVMVHLLDVGEKLHKNIIRVCSYPTDDQVKKEIGLKLLSLYIPEIWCGAKVPQLLLMHAQLITRRRKNSQKSSRTHIMQICEDILSAVD
ncbi:LOW QUALITY PROTEIN: nucleolar pre-ribosomal-associated protein 1 [Silurus meridionalis]|uniref:LOW QUALITY PROTEIN: nucleolar pre-ribosomal-associated protein 1 n=1 Tax=Silurus meridionalis TaxID=175797 RepID=UPI001EEC0D32|nr:LOW QUALITY PROTEIN: nucleolar pre-ribosomal-associated protein 1 [Silurus meridionalis]